MNQFEDIMDKMNKKILDYKKNKLKKLDNIINEIKNWQKKNRK